ncbi:MAG: hypothetical protein ACRCTE_00880 [Cellulosilyticaceae bacterium]
MKKSDTSLYFGLLLVLFGVVFFLDLNGILPARFYSEYINIILGVIAVIAYFRSKKLWVLMVGTFFIANGGIIWIGQYFSRWTYLSAIALIPGVMFLVAAIARRSTMFLVPGAMLTSWGIYVLMISARLITGFSMIMGMFFIFTAMGFFIVFVFEQAAWAGIPTVVLGVIGIFIVTLGMGEIARNVLMQIVAIAIVVLGLGLIVRGMIHRPKDKE